ncbi:cyclic pyranopterin phosphate synthase MoaA [Gammaproteobacteria bacterium 45_16_T64]|nr:cyclic pyranopterin phosphate synthase MoaA [Gammaproteobacteria bacterium 45_16_T64]
MINKKLIDQFGRKVSYLRVSVTDRCDYRCVYCMAEEMTFLPRSQILTLEEQFRLCKNFVEMGVQKIRLTGGEPLIRRNIMALIEPLGALEGLRELVITTNGSKLKELAKPIRKAGVSRINVSLDSLQPERFKEITRTGKLSKVLEGIEEAVEAGFERIKINAIIIKGRNEDEIMPLIRYVKSLGIDITFIEEMPLGTSLAYDRAETFMSSVELQKVIAQEFTLVATDRDSGGPARYFDLAGSRSRVGFISPHSNNFCSTCNRVRLTSEGRLLLCLGNEHSVDLRALVREQNLDDDQIKQALLDSMDIKPEKHHFDLAEKPQIVRFMNMTGG